MRHGADPDDGSLGTHVHPCTGAGTVDSEDQGHPSARLLRHHGARRLQARQLGGRQASARRRPEALPRRVDAQRARRPLLLPQEVLRRRPLLSGARPARQQRQCRGQAAHHQCRGRDTQLLERHLLRQRAARDTSLLERTLAPQNQPLPQAEERCGGRPSAGAPLPYLPQRRTAEERPELSPRTARHRRPQGGRQERRHRVAAAAGQQRPQEGRALSDALQPAPAAGSPQRSHRRGRPRREQSARQLPPHHQKGWHPGRRQPLWRGDGVCGTLHEAQPQRPAQQLLRTAPGRRRPRCRQGRPLYPLWQGL